MVGYRDAPCHHCHGSGIEPEAQAVTVTPRPPLLCRWGIHRGRRVAWDCLYVKHFRCKRCDARWERVLRPWSNINRPCRLCHPWRFEEGRLKDKYFDRDAHAAENVYVPVGAPPATDIPDGGAIVRK